MEKENIGNCVVEEIGCVLWKGGTGPNWHDPDPDPAPHPDPDPDPAPAPPI